MAVDTLAIADRLERSGVASPHARAIAAELGDMREAMRGELVTREYLDLALAKLRAEIERDIAQLHAGVATSRAEIERDIAQLRADTAASRAGTERDIGALRLDTERLLREQTNRIVVWLGAIVGIAVTLIGGLGVLS